MRVRSGLCAGPGACLVVAAVLVACSSGTAPTGQQTSAPVTAASPPPTTAAAPPPPPPPATDEDQIKETVLAFQDAYNTENWAAYTELMCTAMRVKFTGTVMDMVRKGRHDTGLTQVKTVTPTVTGDTATVTMVTQNETMGTKTVPLPLKKEDGWKICVIS